MLQKLGLLKDTIQAIWPLAKRAILTGQILKPQRDWQGGGVLRQGRQR